MQAFEILTQEGRAVELAMQELWLGGEVLPVGARLVARHVFASAEEDPLEVIYSFMLPRDAALRQFRIEGDGFSVHSDLQPVNDAERLYEDAMSDGFLTTMTRQYRDGVTSLMVGNLHPGKRVTVYLEIIAGVEAHDDGFRFRFPFTLAPSYHPRASAVRTAPGEGEMELPEETFGGVILPPYRDDPADLHRTGFDLTVKAPGGAASLQSPSHTVSVNVEENEAHRVALSREADVPNRDLVLDVTLREPRPLIYAGTTPGGKTAVAACIPSGVFGEAVKQASRSVFVIDRSGSMDGAPMEQAKKALRACLGALSPDDAFNIVAFDNTTDIMHQEMVRGDGDGRAMANEFLDEIDARGGTELPQALLNAAALLKDGGGDIFLLTDGQVHGTEDIFNRIKSGGIRVHVLGIGSASQDRFLNQLARQTGGTSRFITPRERVDNAALELFASIGHPVATGLKVSIEGDGAVVHPSPGGTVFAGSPVVVYGEADRAEAMVLNWSRDGADGELRLDTLLGTPELAETLRLIRGARLIADFEALMETESAGTVARREAKRRDSRLEQLSREYGLASRVMSLVAVVAAERDAGGKLPKTRVVPVGMPEDTAFDAYFAQAAFTQANSQILRCMKTADFQAKPLGHKMKAPRRRESSDVKLNACYSMPPSPMSPAQDKPAGEELLMVLAALIEPDGGMPGKDNERRLIASLLALLCFVANGHTQASGAYRRHVKRLSGFIEGVPSGSDLPGTPREMLEVISSLGPAYPDWEEEANRLIRKPGQCTAKRWAHIYARVVTPSTA